MKDITLIKIQKILNTVIKTIICVFLVWFYFNMIILFKLSTFLVLFLGFPLIVGLSIYNLLPVSFVYSFFIGFLIQWILFLNVNVYPLDNDNKYEIMNYIPDNYKPNQEYLLSEYYKKMDELQYPIILKPIRCSGGAQDIYILRSYQEYINLMLETHVDIEEYMIQTYMQDYEIEIGVLYERNPLEKNGKVLEITEKISKTELRTFVDGMMENRSYLINDKVNELFDTISKKIPGLYVGRYDIRLKNLEDLENGDMKIIEINGTMGMSLLYNDRLKWDDFNNLFNDTNWYLKRLHIGGYNMMTGKGYSPLNLLQCMYKSLLNGLFCNDLGNWENLFSLYS